MGSGRVGVGWRRVRGAGGGSGREVGDGGLERGRGEEVRWEKVTPRNKCYAGIYSRKICINHFNRT